jgi:SET domain
MEATSEGAVIYRSRHCALLKEIVETSKDTILSYHCDQVNLEHTTCVGIAAQGHIIIHTSPQLASFDVYGIALEQVAVKRILGRPLVAKTVSANGAPDSTRSQALRDTRTASAFVNPAMLASENPQMVVLVGGSVASLKQILKHVAVTNVILLNMEPVGSTIGVDLSRIEQPNETALEWFEAAGNGTVHAIFVESPGLADIVPSATRALKEDHGVLVTKASVQSEKHRIIKAQWIQAMLDQLQGRFGVIKEYEEGEANFLVYWGDDSHVGKWFASEAEIKLAIREKMLPPFDSVDAVDILSYHVPSRHAEDAFCAANPTEELCINGHGMDPERPFAPISFFEVKLSTVENAGRGVYATRDIAEGSYTFVDTCLENVHFTDTTFRVISAFTEDAENLTIPLTPWEVLIGYADGYGFNADYQGQWAHDVDPSIATFCNHGCNGTANSGEVSTRYITEYDYSAYEETSLADFKMYNPALDRSIRTYNCAGDVALRDIKAGEEIFNNYVVFVDLEDLDEYAASLRAECEGSAIGQISEYEMSAKAHRIQHSQETIQFDSNSTQLNSNTSQGCLFCGIPHEIS